MELMLRHFQVFQRTWSSTSCLRSQLLSKDEHLSETIMLWEAKSSGEALEDETLSAERKRPTHVHEEDVLTDIQSSGTFGELYTSYS